MAMTEREFLTAIINIDGIADDLKAHAEEGIAKLDARNDKRKNTETKAQKENRELMGTILHLVAGTQGKVASEIATAMGVSTQKASALCSLLVKEGLLSVTDTKVKGKGAVKLYTPILTHMAEADLSADEEVAD